jgi:putative nucleotidyltransferase with HDIG domain
MSQLALVVGVNLIALALIAELYPVHFQREGVFVSLSLPFVAALLIVGGPTAAVIGEGLVVFLAGLVTQPKSRGLVPKWTDLNLPITLFTAGVSSVGWLLAQHLGFPPIWGVIGFVLIHVPLNMLLVKWVAGMVGAQRLTGRVVQSQWLLTIGLATYGALAIAVAVLVQEQVAYLACLLLAPIFLLRGILHAQKVLDDQAYETIVALTIMLQRAHPYTHGHLERVGRIAEDVGHRLNLPPARARLLREAAVLHDIGKIAIDEMVLDKPAKLTDEEYEHVKQHSDFGAKMLERSARFAEIVPWIRHHHERPDGRGYPHQMADPMIPIESKVIAVADAYDAMVGGVKDSEKRSYRKPITPKEAVAELRRCSGSQFDPVVVDAFVDALGQEATQ